MSRLRFWNEKAETMSRDELGATQLDRLKWTVKHAWSNNDFYRDKLTAVGLEPGDMRSLDDLGRLPFLTKDDFRDQYPLKMLCAPRIAVREMHMSSGSTGTPVVMAYTETDLVQWAECMARCQVMAGMQPGETIQIMPTFGLFNGGFGFYHGARLAGLFVVPASSGNTARQVMLMRDFKVRGIGSVVSYASRIIENDHGVTDVRINVEACEGVTGYMVEKHLKERLGFSPQGDVFKAGTLPRGEGKAKRVFWVDK